MWYFCLKWRMYDLMWIKILEVDPGPQILSSALSLSFSIWLASKSGHSIHAVSDYREKKKKNLFPESSQSPQHGFCGSNLSNLYYVLITEPVTHCLMGKKMNSLAMHGSGVHSWKKELESVPPNHMNWEWCGRVMWGEKVLHQKLEMLERKSNC